MKQSEPVVWRGYYKGDEFPEHYGYEIEYKDDHTDPDNPCYQIRFIGEADEWYGNQHDEDISNFPV